LTRTLRIVSRRELREHAAHQGVPVGDATGGVVALVAIRRRREHERRALAIHDARHSRGIGAVAAQQSVIFDQPEVTGASDRLAGRSRHVVGGVIISGILRLRPVIERRHEPVEIGSVEAGQPEIEAERVQRMQLV
jgi:hypothetical protein